MYYIDIEIRNQSGVKCRLKKTANLERDNNQGLPKLFSEAMVSLIALPVSEKTKLSCLATSYLQRCHFERGQERKLSGAGSSFSRSWASHN